MQGSLTDLYEASCGVPLMRNRLGLLETLDEPARLVADLGDS
jgi:hypothetical protein